MSDSSDSQATDWAEDRAKLLKALRAERGWAKSYLKERNELQALLTELLPRVEALEAQPGGGADMGQLLTGLAEIRGDMRQQVERLRLEMRAELDELAEQVRSLIRA